VGWLAATVALRGEREPQSVHLAEPREDLGRFVWAPRRATITYAVPSLKCSLEAIRPDREFRQFPKNVAIKTVLGSRFVPEIATEYARESVHPRSKHSLVETSRAAAVSS